MDSISLIMLIILFWVHFLPALVAVLRKHHQSAAIFALNLLLGWTLLGWVVALVWAFTAIRREVPTTT